MSEITVRELVEMKQQFTELQASLIRTNLTVIFQWNIIHDLQQRVAELEGRR